MLSLTTEQIATIKASSNPHIYYYDPDTGTLTDMNATFDLTTGTAAFTTTHFSTYVLATPDTKAPVISGVVDNGVYSVSKTITFIEGTATLDGKSFKSGATVSKEGKHTIFVTDAAGNKTTVVFVIDKTAPKIMLNSSKTAVKNGGFSHSNVSISVSDLTAVTKTVALNGKASAWPSNSIFTKEGKYIVIVKDQDGHVTKTSFTIDKTAPKITVNGGKGVVTIAVTEANLSAMTVTLNGKKLAWTKNNRFTKNGVYVITEQIRLAIKPLAVSKSDEQAYFVCIATKPSLSFIRNSLIAIYMALQTAPAILKMKRTPQKLNCTSVHNQQGVSVQLTN